MVLNIRTCRVLYISLHWFDHGYFYPDGDAGHHSKVGAGLGEGFNVNIPWNAAFMGDAEYLAAFQQIILPIAYEVYCTLLLLERFFYSTLLYYKLVNNQIIILTYVRTGPSTICISTTPNSHISMGRRTNQKLCVHYRRSLSHSLSTLFAALTPFLSLI